MVLKLTLFSHYRGGSTSLVPIPSSVGSPRLLRIFPSPRRGGHFIGRLAALCGVCVMLSTPCRAEFFTETSWSLKQGPFVYDKLDNFLFFETTDNVVLLILGDTKSSLSWSLMLPVLNEIKDGVLRWDCPFCMKAEKIIGVNPGGSGFDWKDAIAGMAGVCFNRFVFIPFLKWAGIL